MAPRPLPTRSLPDRPHLEQLRRQARELLDGVRAGADDVVAEARTHFRDLDAATFALHDAQLVLARAYGFESWPKLKAFVDGITLGRLRDAIIANDLESVGAMLQARPELAHASMDNLQMLHHALFNRSPGMVRLLMRHGAPARHGVYPHRDATSALTIALERGYEEIVRIIEEEEPRQRESRTEVAAVPQPDELFAAVAAGDIARLQARHAEGTLTNPIGDSGGLLRMAVRHDRGEILAWLLDCGFDPDERIRIGDSDDHVFSWGMPLCACACSARYALAEMLLNRGADPNASVYASGDPIFWALGEGDWKMVDLLQQYGGVPVAGIAASFRQTELAAQMLAGDAPYRLEQDATLAGELLSGGATGGDPAIVRMALARVDWQRDDPRWFAVLEQPLRFWAHGSASANWDRTTYLTCFRLLLERCDPNLRGRVTDNHQFGLTILHSIAGSRPHLTADDRVQFATAALEAGARLDIRDHLLQSTPLGWACRWGRPELVTLFLSRGADPVEPDAEPWATPLAWAGKSGHAGIVTILESAIS